MERVMKSIGAILFTMLAVAALSTCVNPFDWVARVSDEVMQAKDLYLQVTGVTPVNNETAFSPEDTILITFDREVDLDSVTASEITFVPAASWSNPSFAAGTLTLDPDSLEGETAYEVTIGTGIRGKDGSALRDPYVWKFTTTNVPSGTITMKDRSTGYDTYTNELLVNLAVSANGVVNTASGVRYSMTSFAKDDESLPWQSVTASVASFNMGGSASNDGERTLYYQFRDAADHRTEVKTDTITQDITAPVVNSLGTVPTYLLAGGWNSNASVTETGSGIVTYQWTKNSGTGTVSFAPDNALNTYVEGTVEGTISVRLRVYDAAGNTHYLNSSTMTIDINPPSVPSVTVPSSPTTDTTPTWTWVSGGGGNGYYQYRFDDGSWSSETTALTATLSISEDEYGSHNFRVKERDAAGNWSPEYSDSLFIYPSYLSPAQPLLPIIKVDRSPLVQWAASASIGTTWDIYLKVSTALKYTKVLDDTPDYQVQMSKAALAANTTYYWYFTRTRFGATVRFPAGEQHFTFYTNDAP